MSWPHGPVHRALDPGAYIVTAGTYNKENFYTSPESLADLEEIILTQYQLFGWHINSWAVFSNHYHVVADTPAEPNLDRISRRIHSLAAIAINKRQNRPGRKVWHEYWDTQIHTNAAYLARVNYVTNNAVKHNLVRVARDYPWCSANWLAESAPKSFNETLGTFDYRKISERDDFEPVMAQSI